MRPFWPRSGAIGVSTTIGAPQATQGLVRRASFIFLLLLPLMSDVLITIDAGEARCYAAAARRAACSAYIGRQGVPEMPALTYD